MDFEFDINGDGYTMNLDACIADTTTPSVIRQLFRDLKENGYINTGDYFCGVSDTDLNLLLQFAEAVGTNKDAFSEEEQDEALRNLMLLGMGLTVGEGEILTEDTVYQSANSVITFIALEGLYRKGLINIYRDKWSMTQNDNDIIATPKEDL